MGSTKDYTEDVANSIASLARKCQDTFDYCLEVPSLARNNWAEKNLSEFSIWTVGAGAFAVEGASLDSRLSAEQETKKLVTSSLTSLFQCLERCQGPGMCSSLKA